MRSGTLNHELYWQLPKKKNKNVIGLIKDKLLPKNTKQYVG